MEEERDCRSAGAAADTAVEVLVEMESSISTLELVQLQMEGGGEGDSGISSRDHLIKVWDQSK